MKEPIILIGGGGHAESIIDSIRTQEHFEIAGILDNNQTINTEILGVKVLGNDSNLTDYFEMGIKNIVLAIGSIGNTEPRRRLYGLCKKIGYQFPNIMDKSALVPESLKIGEGNFVAKGAIINSRVTIGNACIINTGAIVEHGCVIEDFVHIAPGSILCGNVRVEEDAHIGAHSTILQNVSIGKHTIIGAGSLVLKTIPPNQLAYGHPAKEAVFHE